MALTSLVPVIGAAVFMGDASATGEVTGLASLIDLSLLFVVGACLHVYGFVLNEWADVEVDRASTDLSSKPLVSGTVSGREALAGAVAAGALGFLPLAMVSTAPLPHLLYLLSLLLGGTYDLWGKRVPLDAVLAGSLTALLASGVFSTGLFDTMSQRHWALLAGVAGLQFMQNLFENAIEGGLKDADHDQAAGARTLAVVLGTGVEEGTLAPSRSFVAAAAVMKAIHLSVLGWMALLVVGIGKDAEGFAVGALVVVSSIAMVFTLVTFMARRPFDRPWLKRRFSIHEMATYLGTVVVLEPLLGPLQALVLLVLPVAWFVSINALLFGRPLEPGV